MIKEILARKAVDIQWSVQYRKKRKKQRRSMGHVSAHGDFSAMQNLRVEERVCSGVALSDGVSRMTISVLDKDLMRVCYMPDGKTRLERSWMVCGSAGDLPAEGRLRDDYSVFACPDFSLSEEGSAVAIDTGLMQCRMDLRSGSISWSSGGLVFAEDADCGGYSRDVQSAASSHCMKRMADFYYGFGEKTGPINKLGRRLVMMDTDVMGYNAENEDPLYKNIPFYISFNPATGTAYGVFYDNLSISEFDICASSKNDVRFNADNGDIDMYMIYGPTVRDVVMKFVKLTGPMILPPRWTLGYLGSTMTYTERADAQEQLKRFTDLCAAHDIPCDLFHLSSGYTSGADGKRYVFEWNNSKVPDPKAMVDYFHKGGIKLTANIKPAMLTTHPRYGEVAAFGGFIKNADGSPHVTPFWGGVGSYLDFTNPLSREWWKTGIRQRLLHYDIDSTWNDNNEFEIWDENCRCDMFGSRMSIAQLRPLQTFLMVQTSYETQKQARPGKRPYLITRSGCGGIQRYAQTWTGDNFTSWSALKYNIPMGLGLSLSNVANIGHDVGGFFGFKPSPELFIRWVQNGIMHPRFTVHSWHIDKTVNEPWMFKDALPIIRDTIRFRYRMMPFLYSLFYRTHKTGEPIIRPMCYSFAHDKKCADNSFDYMMGDHLLCATVYEKGARRRAVYLPEETEWLDFYRGTHYAGGRTVVLDAPLDRIPLLVKAGGIIPMGGVMKYTGEKQDDFREILLYPHNKNGSGEFHLIEDDGESMDYEKGIIADISMLMNSTSERIDLTIKKTGSYAPAYTRMSFVLPAGENRDLYINGNKAVTDIGADGNRCAALQMDAV